MARFYCLLAIFMATIVTVFAQTSINLGSVSSATTCNATIYDNGGSTGAYGSNLNQTLTIFPESNQGRISLQINSIDIHQNDTLYIYDGSSANGTPIAKINNSNYTNTSQQSYTADISNTSGAMTIRFKTSSFWSIFGNHGQGFKITAKCVPACQTFQIAFDTNLCTKLPTLDPEDGYLYLDLCPGENPTLAIKTFFPQNDTKGYHQKVSTTKYEWNINNGITSGLGMQTLNYNFEESHGYSVAIKAQDTLSCSVAQPLSFRVRTSKNPVTSITSIPEICVGDEVTPTVGFSNFNNIHLQHVGDERTASLVINDTVFLPDGVSCPPYGTFYRSEVTFTDFAPNAAITTPNDILFVRIKMEHSAIEDLKIKLICPNNQQNTILPNPNYSSSNPTSYFRVNLGSAYRPDGSASCNSNLNPMGDPWNYVWSNNTSLGYQYAAGNGVCYNTQNFHSHYNSHWDASNISYFGDMSHSFSVDSSNVAMMTNIYKPYQNFSNLIGCPLNGTWAIEVQDLINEDNGYIVEWELALDPDLIPENWDYSVDVDTFYFTQNGTHFTSLQPTQAGNITYTFHLIDDFGCEFDNNFQIKVHEFPEVDLGGDKNICTGESIILKPANINNSWNYKWNNGSTQNQLSVSNQGIYSLTASVVKNGVTLCKNSDTISVSVKEKSLTNISDYTCSGFGYSENGFDISAATLQNKISHKDTLFLQNKYGCDSLVILNLSIKQSYDTHINKKECEQYTWEGQTYTESGTYTKHFTTIFGCDSTVTLHLALGEPFSGETDKVECGEYLWEGDIYSESGTYTKHYTSIYGCDSSLTLNLTIKEHINTEFSVTECEEYTWDGQTFSQSGDYDKIYTASNGCDSISTLHLTIVHNTNTEIPKLACETYEWEGETYDESGTYVRNYVSEHGCDSILTLKLIIDHPSFTEISETVCGQYVWNAEKITESGDYEHTYILESGCDSTVLLHLTVIDTTLLLTLSNEEFCETGETEITATGNFNNFLWNTGEITNTIFVTEGGRYTVTASNEICDKTAYKDIPYCELLILLPNAITPSNGDGLNDRLELPEYIKNQIEDFSIDIFNRFGMRVFHSDDKHFSWDGTVDGKVSINNVFNYEIKCTNKNGRWHKKIGSITVL